MSQLMWQFIADDVPPEVNFLKTATWTIPEDLTADYLGQHVHVFVRYSYDTHPDGSVDNWRVTDIKVWDEQGIEVHGTSWVECSGKYIAALRIRKEQRKLIAAQRHKEISDGLRNDNHGFQFSKLVAKLWRHE